MNDKEKAEHASVLDHLERAMQSRKALLRAPTIDNGSNGVRTVTRRPASAAPKIQEQALVQMQAMLSEVERGADGGGPLTEKPEMAQLRKAVHNSCSLIRDGLSQLTNDVSRLVKASEHHNGRPIGSVDSVPAPLPPTVVEEMVVDEIGMNEPQFNSDQLVHILLAEVPDFERATAVQQALSGLPQASTVAVIEFEDTSASIDMELAAPVNVRQIMEQLREQTGRHYLVELARPEENTLNIRFIQHEEDRPRTGLKPEHWAKA
ncbi:MAG: hypothetical protein IIC10_08375 [Proteobacteria bacterium]|nr:hypothetical protein [Pseudomonadota bacterium]